MQTFLVSSSLDFTDTLKCLDYRRLGKQRVEAYQILLTLAKPPGAAWSNHPAVKMWRGHSGVLAAYHDACIDEWVRRGYNNTMSVRSCAYDDFTLPSWWFDERIYASHRSNLLRKDPSWYGQFGWTEGPDLPYVWPI